MFPLQLPEAAWQANHPYLTLAMFYWLVVLYSLCTYWAWKQFCRLLVILFRGWPPTHCDADGDASYIGPQTFRIHRDDDGTERACGPCTGQCKRKDG